MSLFGTLFPDIAVDIGSLWVRVWVVGKKNPVHVPACMAVELSTKRVLAVGQEAWEMIGRVDKHIGLYFPFDQTGVSDVRLARAFFKVVLSECGVASYASFRVAVSVSAQSTPVQRESIVKLFVSLGARDVVTVAAPLASAIGAGVPIADASGSFVCHIGASRAEVALISLGSTVYTQGVSEGMSALESLVKYQARSHHKIELSNKSVHDCLQQVFAFPLKETLTLQGTAIGERVTIEVQVPRESVWQAVELWWALQKSSILSVLEKIPPELCNDTLEKGLLVTGGFGLVDCAAFMANSLGISCTVPQQPHECVIRGVHTVLTHVEAFKKSLGYV